MSDIIKAQQGLARKAQADKSHQFQDLYHLLCKREWIEEARRHVLKNDGSQTPSIDGISWKDFNDAEKSDFEKEKFQRQFIDELQAELKTHPFKPAPVRRVEIPKPGTSKTRPLGIPIGLSYCLSFQAMFGIPMVANGVDQKSQPTLCVLLYHVLLGLSTPTAFPVSLRRLAQLRDDFWGEGNPTRAMRVSAHTLQNPGVTPIGNRRDVDIEQFRCR